MQALRWRNVALTAVALSAIAAVCVWAPVLAHQREVRERSRLEHLDAARKLDMAGLGPCLRWLPPPPPEPGSTFVTESEPPAFEVGPPPPADADLVVTAMPAFDGPWRVVVRGNQVHLADKGPHSGRRTPPPEDYLREGDATLAPDRARRVVALFERYASRPTQEFVGGADGTYYWIEVKGRCVATWSPDSETGAGRLVDIAQLLAMRASRGEVIDGGRSERAIDILLRSFEHGDGSELVDYGPQRVETNAYLAGPEWDAAAPTR
jgi:hypothetical protein